MTSPDLFAALKRIKSSLEHARRFGPDSLQSYRQACAQAEGDIEELLIDYGFQKSEDREPDSKVRVDTDHQVVAGSGHNGNFRNRTYDEAKAIYDEQSKVPSYFGKGVAGGGTGFQSASLIRITTITEILEKNR